MEEVKASMAGNVWKITVNEGEEIEAEQDVVILESMKMEIPIASQQAGTVKEIKVAEGDFVNEGDVIVVIE
ncbi:MAG TPA: acetyl-CoA carboxylase biotin carboxyl carrier protein subunit [Bacillota bacterium]|nr:acetyl-CoA carboxylase biotin carboxyl carrier protein subunit [Bacillota bacterium]